MRKVIFSFLLSGMLCAPLFAGNPADRREHNQKARIRQGVKSGELTRNETQKLLKEQARIRALERKAKSDQEITRKEVRKLDRFLDKAGKYIHKQKHDNQDRD